VFEYFAQIAHIKPATAGATHQLIGFALRDAIGVTSAIPAVWNVFH